MQRGRQAALDTGLPSGNAELLAQYAAHLKRSPPAGRIPAPALAPSGDTYPLAAAPRLARPVRQMIRPAMAATAACGTVTAARCKMAAAGPVTSAA